jgi:alkylation response protein AidB-like acyl-CoA dehydrogenase
VKLRYDDEIDTFRAELGAWLDENRPSASEMKADPSRSTGHIPGWARSWQQRLFDAGWLVPGWPPELGGRNASPVEQLVFFEEMAKRGLRRSPNYTGITIVAPSILEYGTDQQRQRFVFPVLRGEKSTCLGMSEPGAGSDLAGLSTRAEPIDGGFLVNGQKVWTSGAHDADLCLCFVRTDRDVPKHKGISALLIDMDTPGIRCRPLPHLLDKDRPDFNEVFFTDVIVPKDRLLGQLNAGWAVANTSLVHERAIVWIELADRLESGISRLVREVQASGELRGDPLLRDQLAQRYVDGQALKFLGHRGFSKFVRGRVPKEHALLKLFATETQQRLARQASEALGPRALHIGTDDRGDIDLDSWTLLYFRSFAETIAGGSSEIQRTIIADYVLGLPRSKRTN